MLRILYIASVTIITLAILSGLTPEIMPFPNKKHPDDAGCFS
jgi:hypothetical protein